MKSGSSPGAPLGGHKTQVGVPGEPVAVAAPAALVEPLPRAPAPAPPELPPPPPPDGPEPTLLVVLPLPGAPTEVPDGVVLVTEVEVPASGAVVVGLEFGIVGSAIAPPAPG